MNGYPSFYPKIALVAPSPDNSLTDLESDQKLISYEGTPAVTHKMETITQDENASLISHDIWWRHQMEYFPCYWSLVGMHRSLVNSPHKCQWRGALMFCWICAWTNGWVKKLRRLRAHYDVIISIIIIITSNKTYVNKKNYQAQEA